LGAEATDPVGLAARLALGGHPIAPTEFPKGRSSAGGPGPDGLRPAAIYAPREGGTLRRSRPETATCPGLPPSFFVHRSPSANRPQTPAEPATVAAGLLPRTPERGAVIAAAAGSWAGTEAQAPSTARRERLKLPRCEPRRGRATRSRGVHDPDRGGRGGGSNAGVGPRNRAWNPSAHEVRGTARAEKGDPHQFCL